MDTLEKIAKVKELLPKLKDPARIAKAQQFLASHGDEQKSGFVGSGTGNQQEGLAGIEDKLPAQTVTATMPENPSLLSTLGGSLGSAAVGLDNGVTAGILHRIASAELPMGTEHGKSVADAIQAKTAHGLANKPGETTADTMERISEEDPLSSGAGGIASLLVGGLPAFIESGLGRAMGKVGLKAAPSAIAKQAGLGALRGAGTALATGGIQDAAEAADNSLQDKPTDMSTEGAKMAIRALLGLGGGGLGGALGARAASNLDPMTSAGAGGTAQQVARIRRQGGDIGLAGVDVPPSLKPLYDEAMTGGTEITPRVGGITRGGAPGSKEAFLANGLQDVSIPQSGMRPESMDYLRGGGEAHGGPVRIGVEPDGTAKVIDGRHRLTIARENGDSSINAEVFGYDSDGNVVWKHKGDVPLQSQVGQEPVGRFSPGSHVEDVAAEKALGPVQKGIAEVDRGQAQKFAAIDDAFYNSPSVQRQRFVPTKIADTLKRFAQARVMDDGTPVPYANAGEPIKELNKLFNVGAPIREFDKHSELLAAQPGSFALPMEEAAKLGLVPNVSRGASGAPGAGEKAFVVITPKQVSPQQFEQAMAGVNNAAKAAEVRGAPDALHAELQQAGFRDREQIQWPAEVPWPAGVSREVAFTIPGDKGSTTLRNWAAIQAQKAEKLGNLERDLFFMGTTPAEATNETTGTRAILNALKQVGGPGASRTERSLSKFAVNQPGGREALNDMESINTIEGSSGLRKKLGAEGVNPFSAHNRHALGLRLDPAMRAAGTILPRAGAVTPLDDRKAIQMLLGIKQ